MGPRNAKMQQGLLDRASQAFSVRSKPFWDLTAAQKVGLLSSCERARGVAKCVCVCVSVCVCGVCMCVSVCVCVCAVCVCMCVCVCVCVCVLVFL